MTNLKEAAEMAVSKKIERLAKRGKRASELGKPIWLNATTAMVPTANAEEATFYKVSIKDGHEGCGCKDWEYRGSVNGIPCKHMIRALVERMVRDSEKAEAKVAKEILAEANQAVEDGQLPPHAPEHDVKAAV